VFTGIVREIGRVTAARGDERGLALEVEAPETAALVAVGGSVAVNGCCLTAESVEGARLSFHAVPETLARTTLGALAPQDEVNVEPALRAGDPLGGHFVQGHVDAVGRVAAVEPEGEGVRILLEAPAHLLRYCVEKGSIAVDGVSLTVARLHDDGFEVALVPHTLRATTLSALSPGRAVNLEADVLAKHVERLVGSRGG
jgi:riboflavin synthase alpha subunit